nr:MAG TPA: hypothetical protein [Bacteriophage sp.]
MPDCKPPGVGSIETLTPQQVQHLPAIHTRQEPTPPGLHGLRCAALSGMDL